MCCSKPRGTGAFSPALTMLPTAKMQVQVSSCLKCLRSALSSLVHNFTGHSECLGQHKSARGKEHIQQDSPDPGHGRMPNICTGNSKYCPA